MVLFDHIDEFLLWMKSIFYSVSIEIHRHLVVPNHRNWKEFVEICFNSINLCMTPYCGDFIVFPIRNQYTAPFYCILGVNSRLLSSLT